MIKKSNEQTLKDALNLLLSRNGAKEKYSESRVVWAWEQCFGKDLQQDYVTAYVRNKTLFVKIVSPALKENLKYQHAEIIAEINRVLEEELITGVVFV